MGRAFVAGGNTAMNVPSTGLPNGYTRLAYIQSSGGQYVDTGFKPNQDTRVVMDAQLVKSDTTYSANTLFGCRKAANAEMFSFFWHTTQEQFYVGYNSSNMFLHMDYSARRVVDFNKNVVTAGEETSTTAYGAFSSSYNMTLLALNQASGVVLFAAAKLYSCQIYDNGTLVRDFVPCINDAGEVGLYDRENSKFYKNAGSGVFTGSEVA